jgi:hypothetical protein
VARLAYYGDEISPNMTKTPEGYLICRNVPIGRVGEMQYLGRELGDLGLAPDEPVTVRRTEAELFSPAAIASFEGKPVTNGHPPQDVEIGNWAAYSKGHAQNVRRGQGEDADKMVADLFVTDAPLAAEIDAGKRGVSSGYDLEYTDMGDGTYGQGKIRGNHVAVVWKGRAGPRVSIKDSMPERRKRMGKASGKFGGILGLLARGARDAKTADEVDEIVGDAAEAVEALAQDGAAQDSGAMPPAGQGLAQEPKQAPGAEASAKADDGSGAESAPDPLAALAQAIGELSRQVAEIRAGQLESAEAKDAGGRAGAEPGGDRIQALIDELEAGGPAKSPEAPEAGGEQAGQDEALTVPADSIDCAGKAAGAAGGALRDEALRGEALKMLRRARPAIAAITNTEERARVADALAGSIRDAAAGQYAAALGAAEANALDAAPSGGAGADAEQAAYDRRNPHKRKGD